VALSLAHAHTPQTADSTHLAHTHTALRTHTHTTRHPQSFGDRPEKMENGASSTPSRCSSCTRHEREPTWRTTTPRARRSYESPARRSPGTSCEPWPVRLYGANTLRAILHMLKRKFGNTRSANNSQLFPVPLQLDSLALFSLIPNFSHFSLPYPPLQPLSPFQLTAAVEIRDEDYSVEKC
jgi:hypothetical protein